MSEAFKNLINTRTIESAGHHLQRVWPAFDRAGFEQAAGLELDSLEMKARAMQIAQALEHTLPADFDRACSLIECALAAPVSPDSPASGQADRDGLAGWIVWSLGEYVARQVGLDGTRLPRGLAALHALTQRFSAEFAIRPLIRDHPAAVFDVLSVWAGDPSAHVRRLVSEGSRPRLPWGLRLHALIADPSPSLPLLERLQDDDSGYVRRSVANHLNDIAKDHPERVAQWLQQHLPQAPEPRRALLRHASRVLIKQGHAPTLNAWGLGRAFSGSADLSLSPQRVTLGDSLLLTLRLDTRSRRSQTLVIDYAVHHVKANGETSPKVFKGWSITLAPGETREFIKRHSLRPITTRRYYAGRHRVEILINGQTQATADFDLGLGAH